jgi:hypothetical protein
MARVRSGHAATAAHRRQAARAVAGALPRSMPAWAIALRRPDAQYAEQDARLADRRAGLYPPVGIDRLIGDPE